jgi:hypothetical protein
MYCRIFGFDTNQIDPRLNKEDKPLKDEDFFSSFESYPGAE